MAVTNCGGRISMLIYSSTCMHVLRHIQTANMDILTASITGMIG